jgi:uncharacterized protein YcbX
MKDFPSLEEAIAYFQTFQAHIVDLEEQKKEALQRYQRETAAYFGVADGTPINLLQMARLVKKMQATG